jgi:hypothetical protein
MRTECKLDDAARRLIYPSAARLSSPKSFIRRDSVCEPIWAQDEDSTTDFTDRTDEESTWGGEGDNVGSRLTLSFYPWHR